MSMSFPPSFYGFPRSKKQATHTHLDTNENQNTQAKDQYDKNAPTEQNERKKVYKNTNEFILSWPASPGHEAYGEVNILSETHWRNIFSLQQVSITNNFLVRGGTPPGLTCAGRVFYIALYVQELAG